MINRMSHVTILVLDQDSALDFYTNKLGLEVRTDVSMGDGFEGAGAGFRWLTVGHPGGEGPEYILADCAMSHDAESAEQIRAMVAKGSFGPGVWETDDVQATYRELSGRGVVFIQEPAERPYGVEAIFRDDSGNWYSLSQHP